ncbi:MAG: hypothetical protein M3P51_14960 [Chloroflexota bacterium]|nr:hypothetical protein [Chloroflexota bacterium]
MADERVTAVLRSLERRYPCLEWEARATRLAPDVYDFFLRTPKSEMMISAKQGWPEVRLLFAHFDMPDVQICELEALLASLLSGNYEVRSVGRLLKHRVLVVRGPQKEWWTTS